GLEGDDALATRYAVDVVVDTGQRLRGAQVKHHALADRGLLAGELLLDLRYEIRHPQHRKVDGRNEGHLSGGLRLGFLDGQLFVGKSLQRLAGETIETNRAHRTGRL